VSKENDLPVRFMGPLIPFAIAKRAFELGHSVAMADSLEASSASGNHQFADSAATDIR